MSENQQNDQTLSEEELLQSSQKTIEDLLTDEELLLSSQSQESSYEAKSQGSQASTGLLSSQGSEILESVDSELSKSNDDQKSSQWDFSACNRTSVIKQPFSGLPKTF